MNVVGIALLVSLIGNVLQITLGLLNFFEKIRQVSCQDCKLRKRLSQLSLETGEVV